MSYPQGNPGYPPASQQTTQYAPAPQFSAPQEQVPAGPSKLPIYLNIAVVVFGLAVYLSSFGPLFRVTNDVLAQALDSPSGAAIGLAPLFTVDYLVPVGILASTLAALVAGAALLTKRQGAVAAPAMLSVLGLLNLIAGVVSVPSEVSAAWALYLILAFSVLQTVVAVGALLLDAGVITAPVPKPKYEQPQQQQYNPYAGGPPPYYGQPIQSGPMPPQAQPQRPGYPPQYGAYPNGPSTGGFAPMPHQNGPPTPPTGFPAYGHPQPQSAGPATSVLPPQSPQQDSSQESAPPPA